MCLEGMVITGTRSEESGSLWNLQSHTALVELFSQTIIPQDYQIFPILPKMLFCICNYIAQVLFFLIFLSLDSSFRFLFSLLQLFKRYC